MLKPETQALWDQIRDKPALHGFVLIGGTALAMHIGHRVSEDLDLAWPGARLPRQRITALRRALEEVGATLVANDSMEAIREFEDSGMELHDYQQNYLANESVKLTFVAPDQEVAVQMNAADPKRLRIATMDEIFRLKCVACANRSKTRDWFDMYTLFERGDFQPIDMIEPFERAKAPQKLNIALHRMCSGVPDAGDEGYDHLLAAPPSLEEMRARLIAARDDIEVALASRRAAAKRRLRP